METLLHKIASLVIAPFIFLGSLFSSAPLPEPVQTPLAASNAIETPVALFTTSLASKISSTATTMTLTNATTKDGSTLASSTYSFILDEGTASEEFVKADCTSTACTNMERGLSVVTGTTTVAALKKEHNRGASVKITDAPILLNLTRIINGIGTIPNKLSYTSHPTFLNTTELVDKAYVDGIAIAGSPDASTAAKGISKLSVAPVSATNPIAVGDNDGRVLTQAENDLVGVIAGGTDFYGASVTGTDAYATTTSPSIAAYATGMKFRFKADVANTGAATLAVNGLSALAIKKLNDQDLATGDIEAGQIVEVVYDGVDFQMQSQTAQVIATNVKFGGTGADGALALTSGATNIDLAGAAVVTKNYTSISITGTGSLTFTNPHANGTIIILKSQGDVTLTSSTAPMINLNSLGGGTPYSNLYYVQTGGAGGGTGGGTGGAGGAGTGAGTSLSTLFNTAIVGKTIPIVLGGAGGSGGSGVGGGGGAGGRGGGGLIIESNGAFNFTTAGGISATGAVGANGVNAGSGGGGGGAGGTVYILYNTLTTNTGTITLTAGAGGTGEIEANTNVGGGGGGGSSIFITGSAGEAAVSTIRGGNGGAGASGYSLVIANTEFN